MLNRFSQRIIKHISNSRYSPQKPKDLGKELAIPEEDFDEFAKSVQQLIDDGHVLLSPTQAVSLPPPGREMIGSFRANARGFGFIIPESPMEHGDLFVPPGQTKGAMTGDRVKAKVYHQPRRGGGSGDRSPYTGEIVEIIMRAERQYVGNLEKRGNQWIVQVDGKLLPDPIIIRDPHAKNAKEGDKVVLELATYPSVDGPGLGVIVEVLGEGGQPKIETVAVMRAYGLADEFPQEVLEQARTASRAFDENSVPADRLDLTKTFICTIDPPDAKDYDDAISIEKFETSQPDGAVWELGVHIADVSHFVQPGTALDEEAKKRGNSTYLPRRVVPMLPELLSNGVCSLQEGVNRFTKSAFIRYDEDGKVLGESFASAVIRSAKRLTYLEAQALIDGDLKEAIKHAKTEPKYPPQLAGKLKLMDELAKVIRERRMHDGMIVLGLPEVQLEYDESGRVIDAHPTDDAFTHTLIEQFMVEANEATARLFDRYSVPMIRRIHADPPSHDVSDLRRFARVAGFNIPAHPNRKELQQLLDSVRGKPSSYAVHLAVLQTLSRAEYSPLLIGHFALASEHYTHFTSPIRRYPDLIIHRGIKAYLHHLAAFTGSSDPKIKPNAKQKKQITTAMLADKQVPDEQGMFEIGKHCSTTERNSQSAESELRTYLVLELLSTLLGQDFEATVTGMSAGGVFMQLNHYLVDGFIRVADLPSASNDQWRLNRTTGSLVAQRSGKTISIGDRFKVRIARVIPTSRQLDLVIIESADKGEGKGNKNASKNRPLRQDEMAQGNAAPPHTRGPKSSNRSGSGRPSGKAAKSDHMTAGGPAGADKPKSNKKKFRPRKKPK